MSKSNGLETRVVDRQKVVLTILKCQNLDIVRNVHGILNMLYDCHLCRSSFYAFALLESK
jgi:hypothetical protein